MKLMGIDYGRRRIGVAVSDDGGTLARGLCVIDRQKFTDGAGELMRLISVENPAALVFGVPLGPNDEETVMSEEARAFAAEVGRRSGLPINFIDESFTSKKAAGLMLHRKKKARRDKALSDRIAACLILQDYINNSGS